MDLPSLRQLEYAVALAEHRHFGRAAAAVHVSQPGLSGQIRQLEDRLGVVLFERGGRRVDPTPAGREIIDRARLVLREANDLAHAAIAHQGALRGELRIAAIPTIAPYLLPTVVRAIHERWPDAHLSIQEQQTAPQVGALERGDLDIGLLAVPYDIGTLHAEPLLAEPFHLALPADHELAGSAPIAVSALADLEVLLLPEGHCLRDHALAACEVAGRVSYSEVQAASLSTLTQMVATGVGVTLLPSSALAVEARDGTGITTRRLEDPATGRTIALAWRPTDPRAELYGDLVGLLAEKLAALGPA